MGALEKNGESTRKGWYWNEKAAMDKRDWLEDLENGKL